MQKQRHDKIIELLKCNVILRIDELCELLAVSPATVRRDLSELEKQGAVKRMNGGAVLNQPIMDDRLQHPMDQDPFIENKKAIANIAVSMVEEGDTIFIDAGSTNIAISERLTELSNISAITNSIDIAYKLHTSGHPKSLFICGGTIGERAPEASTIGPLAEQMISQFRANIAFIGTKSIDIRHGVTEPDLFIANIKKRMIENSSKVVLVADHSKFDRVNMAHVCPLSHLDHVITDDQVSTSMIEHLKGLGVSVSLAKTGNS